MFKSLLIAAAVFGLGEARGRAASSFLSIPNRVDVAIDASKVVYITSGSSILRYNSATSSFLTPWSMGGSLMGMDISPDGQYLAVADNTTQAGQNRVFVVTLATGAVQTFSFNLAFGEAGTYSTAWAADGSLLVSSSYAGSGWVPLRKLNVSTGVSTVLASVRQDSMLSASFDRKTIAIEESNISSGPVSYYDSNTGNLVAGTNTNWFTFEIGTSKDGQEFAVPTYDGTFIYDRQFQKIGTLGTYATEGPIAAIFSPVGNLIYTPWYSWNTSSSDIRVFDATTLQQVVSYQVQGVFNWNGNLAYQEGREEISSDGTLLAVTVDGGISVVNVPEPTCFGSVGFGGLLLAAGYRKRKR